MGQGGHKHPHQETHSHGSQRSAHNELKGMGGTGLLHQAVQEKLPEGTKGLQTGPWRAGSCRKHEDTADVSGGCVAETSGWEDLVGPQPAKA